MRESFPSQGADYRRIQFGYASAEKESAADPRLLLDGYYEFGGLDKEVLHGHRFLLLGYKGSGKSAVGQRLRLLGERDPELFVRTTFIADFPFSHFRRIVQTSGPTDPEAYFPSLWTWILLMQLLNSFAEDEGAKMPAELSAAIATLRSLGFLPAVSMKQLVLQSAKTTIRASLSKALEAQHERSYGQTDEDFLQHVEFVKEVASRFRSGSRHLMVIDGLDDILTLKNLQYQVLAALLFAVDRLNDYLSISGVPAKVVVLCRTDLFTKLPGPNKNKLRQDSSVELDWYHDPRDPGGSHLVKLANHRAKLAYPRIQDLFFDLLPPRMYGRDTRVYLLENTRHTPRDLLQLLSHIQKCARSEILDHDMVASGVRDYSANYFLPEIKDELVGHVSAAQADRLFALLGSMRQRKLTFQDLQRSAERQNFRDVDLERILDLLFDCGAIGNVEPGAGWFWFKFRNRNSTLRMDAPFVLHQGLLKALNVPTS